MKAYSEDLRLRIIAAVDGGMPRSEAARVFGVGRATVKRYLALRRAMGRLDPRPRRGPPPIKNAALAAALQLRLQEAPDAKLASDAIHRPVRGDPGRLVDEEDSVSSRILAHRPCSPGPGRAATRCAPRARRFRPP